MGSSRRKHSREFKVEAVKQVVEKGRSVSEVADGLGINRNLLTRWKTELAGEGAQAFPGNGNGTGVEEELPHAPGKRRRGRRRHSWAELMRRVFLIDVLRCWRCGGTRRLLAAIHDPAAIRKVLGAMGLPAEVPKLASARSPPRQRELEWE